MKSLFAIAALLAVACLCQPAQAFGFGRSRVVVRQQVIVQRHAAVVAVPQFVAPVYAAPQFVAPQAIYGGAQFVAPGCNSFFAR